MRAPASPAWVDTALSTDGPWTPLPGDWLVAFRLFPNLTHLESTIVVSARYTEARSASDAEAIARELLGELQGPGFDPFSATLLSCDRREKGALYTCGSFLTGAGAEGCAQQARGPEVPGAPEGWTRRPSSHPNRWTHVRCPACEAESAARRAARRAVR